MAGADSNPPPTLADILTTTGLTADANKTLTKCFENFADDFQQTDQFELFARDLTEDKFTKHLPAKDRKDKWKSSDHYLFWKFCCGTCTRYISSLV